MIKGVYDNYNTQLKSNPLNENLNQIYINNTSFFPMLEISDLNFSPDVSKLRSEHDIFEKDTDG